ncbi:MAG: hypothetical protein Q7S73_00460 [bacterium]|nr:hypothetical protein [bacterium]
MQTDPLYKKSFAAIFLIAIFGIVLFLNFNTKKNAEPAPVKSETSENNLANISSQQTKNAEVDKKIPELKGLKDLELEQKLIESNNNLNNIPESSEENLNDLLKNF